MKPFTHALFLALAAIALIATTPEAQAADKANIQATLVLGSNNGSGVDGQLARYERHLKRVFKFNSFSQKGGGRSNISLPGESSINIGGGHQVTMNASDAGDGRFRIATEWTRNGQVLINTTVVSAPNQPTVLGGPSEGDGKLILLIVVN